MRPAKVSATTGPADTRSTTGCSPVGSAGKSPRFLSIPHDNNDLRNHRIPQTQGFRVKYLSSAADRHAANIVQLIYRPKGYEGDSKDYEFSRRSMEEHWGAGYSDA